MPSTHPVGITLSPGSHRLSLPLQHPSSQVASWQSVPGSLAPFLPPGIQQTCFYSFNSLLMGLPWWRSG